MIVMCNRFYYGEIFAQNDPAEILVEYRVVYRLIFLTGAL
jgi:hypothetical protein